MRLFVTILIIAAILIYLRLRRQKKVPAATVNPNRMHDLLNEHVRFYKSLEPAQQVRFRERVQQFLDSVAITPVGDVVVNDLDKLYVASSAIIPIFSFDDWSYTKLNEVLIYPGAFTKDFKGNPEERNVLGMVGDGAMNRMMILSIQSLRNGFEQAGKSNTGIHEFVHLLDKADGATDGIPEVMLTDELVGPWMKYMHEAIRELRQHNNDIDAYGGTNDAEFFAVISEYFFQKPEQLREHHPELFELLERIYKRELPTT